MRLLSSVNGKRARGPLAAAKKELDKKQQKQAQKNERMLLRKKQQEEQSRRRSVKGRRNAVSNINVVSRYEPLDYVTRRRVILDWLRDMLRDSWTSTLFISNLFFYISILTIFIFPIFLYTGIPYIFNFCS